MSTPEVTIKRLPKGRTRCTVVFSAEDRKSAEEKALQKIGKNVKIDGFREGHAPANLVRERVQEDKLTEEAVRVLVSENLEEIATKNELAPIIPPSIEIENLDPLTVAIIIIEKPAVKIGKLNTKELKKKESKADEKDVDRIVEDMMRRHQKTSEVDRKSKTGDQITMDFHGKDEKGNEIDGTRAEGYSAVIGSGGLIPGFEEHLTDLAKGEEKSFTVTFPKKYHAEHLQGKPATFTVKVQKVEEVEMPALTDEFAKKHFEAESEKALRERIANSLRQQEEGYEQQRREQAVLEAIRDAVKADFPEELLDMELRSLVENLAKRMEAQGTSFAQWVEQSGKKPEELEEELKKQAEDRLKTRFGLTAFIEDRKIDVSDEEMQQAISEILKQFDDSERIEAASAYQQGSDTWEELKWRKTVEKAIEKALSEA